MHKIIIIPIIFRTKRKIKILYDNIYPLRIIVGTDMNDEQLVESTHIFAKFLHEDTNKKNMDTLFMRFIEAEAVKFFANTCLVLKG